MKGHFAYHNTGYLQCGSCGWSMAPYIPSTPIDNEYTFRVFCGNRNCPFYLEIFEPSDKIKISLISTRLRAPDPNAITPGITAGTTGLIGGAGIGGPTATANAAPIILPRDGVRFENITVPNTGVTGEHIRR